MSIWLFVDVLCFCIKQVAISNPVKSGNGDNPGWVLSTVLDTDRLDSRISTQDVLSKRLAHLTSG